MSFRERIQKQIHGTKRQSLADGLADGIYAVMKEYPGYRLEHFFGQNGLAACQYFELLHYIGLRIEAEMKAQKKIGRGGKRGR